MRLSRLATIAFLVSLGGAASAQDKDLPPGPGSAQFSASCSACHALTQATSQVRTHAEWADIVDQMVSRGAQVSDADYPLIVDYLAKNFGPATDGKAPAPAAPAPQ